MARTPLEIYIEAIEVGFGTEAARASRLLEAAPAMLDALKAMQALGWQAGSAEAQLVAHCEAIIKQIEED